MPFFASRNAGNRWLADHPGVAIFDLDTAREIARAYEVERCVEMRLQCVGVSLGAADVPVQQFYVSDHGAFARHVLDVRGT